MRRLFGHLGFTILVGGSAFAIASCGGSSSSSNFNFSTATISSPFVSTSGSNVVERNSRLSAASFEERAAVIAALTATVTNADDCTFTIDIDQSGTAACYGPRLEVKGTHPDDGADPLTFGNMGNPLPTGDLGIWNSTEGDTTQACTAAQFTAIMDGYTNTAYFAQLVTAAAYCYARTSGLAIPSSASDAALTFDATQLEDFGFADTNNTALSATSVSISPTTDSDGNFGVRVIVAGSVTETGEAAQAFEARLSYAETASDTFRGRASYFVRYPAANEGNCTGTGLTGITSAGTLVFTRAGGSEPVKITSNSGNYCGTAYNPLGDNDAVSYCDEVDNGNAVADANDPDNGWGGNWVYLNFSFVPSTLVGTYVQAWQAGVNDSHLRTFNVNVSSATAATGFFGYANPIASLNGDACEASQTPGDLDGMICNWAGVGSQDHATQIANSALVQRQDIALNTINNVWEVASEQIRYAPTNNCADVAGAPFTYNVITNQANAANSLEQDYSNDDDPNGIVGVADGNPVLDLESLTDYQGAFSLPSEASF